MERRDFIEKSCSTCLGVLALGLVATLAQGCSSLPLTAATLEDNTLRVSLEKMLDSRVMIVRSQKIDSDILLVKNDEVYTALRMVCSHQEQPLTATGSNLYCPSHGSTFDLDGNVTREPATTPLRKYRTEKINNEIIIHLQS